MDKSGQTKPGQLEDTSLEGKQRFFSEDYIRSLLRVNRMLRIIVFLQWILIFALVFGLYYSSQESLERLREIQQKKLKEKEESLTEEKKESLVEEESLVEGKESLTEEKKESLVEEESLTEEK